MNFRLTAILIGVVLLLGVLLLGYNLYEEGEAPPENLFPELKSLRADQIDTVEIEKADGGKLTLVRAANSKDKWDIVEPIKARADANAVSGLVSALMKAKPTTYGGLQSNPASHGLEPPGLKVTLKQGSERSATLNVGTVTLGSEGVVFVTTSSQKRPMAVSRSQIDALFKGKGDGKPQELARWTSDYRSKQIFSTDSRAAGEDVASIKLNAKGKELALSKTPTGWKFDSPAGWGDADVTGDVAAATPTTFSGVRPLLNSLTTLQALGADDFIEQPKDLKEYGLDAGNPDLVRVEMKTKDGPPDVVYIGKKVDAGPTPPAIPGMPATTGKVYVRIEGQDGVIKASGSSLDALPGVIADPNPLRDRTLLSEQRSKIAGIDLTIGGQTTRLRQGGFGQWQLFGGPGDPQNASGPAVNSLLDLLTERRTIKDFPAANDANFAGPELKAEVKLWTETEAPDPKADPKAEPKMKGAPIVLQFGKKDAAGVYVRRILPDGAKNDFLLPEKVKIGGGAVGATGTDADVIAAVAKPRLDFLDPSLKPFSTFQANKLTIQNGPTVTEVTFDKTADPPYFPTGKWKFAKPDAQKDRIADTGTMTDLLNLLATQNASKFVSEQPNEADLARWGLAGATPRLKVIVGLDVGTPPTGAPPIPDADKERVYYLGNETDDHNAVYARMDGRAAVFTAPKFVFERFTTTDLRDKTILRFDKAKVVKIELQGWYDLNKQKTTLKFERKPGAAWTAEGGFPVDPAKVDQFLALLDGLRAKTFIPGPPSRPDFKFAVAPEPNQPPAPGDPYKGFGINLELEGGKRIALNIGDLTDNGNSNFFWCSELPANEQVVTIQSDPFKPFKEKPAVFGR